ncbi:beta-hydroxyacid dehydrogenase, 3-hydroxyisobutyrate dehydrogenase [Synechococcus sp. PCC 7502]|uniref:NAD(P)-dependent oxidoreductase n=1 Tax=Synechococcus sp. PCC 7502 TaxID=1173263 RepID=UPI00029FD93E|nr:NAD(P)-dependent oxidoreductase [Synechococcus sp. PCC 7502]AFY74716.1 beta-hydroxyacid dehydrogenase, 3-hydroxyisobutyrate dehydrogenase [Synechococcus sp. PCC 7502]
MTIKIAFLGLGVMGSAMAANLARFGCAVVGWNRTSDRSSIKVASDAGVTIAANLQDAVKDADVIFSCLGDIPDVTEILVNQVANLEHKSALVIDTSTIGSDAAQNISKLLEARGLRFLDAPVSGGDIGARNGTLTIMVGGDRLDFDQAKPYLDMIGKNIYYCGSLGSGQAVKLCNQVLVSTYMMGICEAVLLAQKTGIDPNLMIEVCGSGAAGSWALSNLGIKVANQDFAPGFMVKHILKDLRIVKAVGDSENLLGVDLSDRLFQIVNELEGGSEQGTQAMIRAYLGS